MGVSKVVLGDETLVDLTSDTVSTENLLQGATAHGADGEEVIGGVVVTPIYTGTKTAIEEAIAAGQIPEDAIVNITDDEEESSFQTQINELNGKLQNENNETFNFGVKNGVRGFFTNPSRADDSFIPFKSVEPMTVFGWLAGTSGVARAWAEIGNFSTVTITTGSSIKIQVSNELDASSNTSGTQIATGSATIDLTQYKDTYKYIGVAGGGAQYIMEFI